MFKHTNSVLRDNDAQMGLKTVNIYGKTRLCGNVYIYSVALVGVYMLGCPKTHDKHMPQLSQSTAPHDWRES